MSAIFRVPFLYTEDLPAQIAWLREQCGVKVLAAHLKASRPYDEADYAGPCAFLIGNEGNGLTDAAADAADARIHIPMDGNIESLNAAMAAGILMFEASRQRRRAGRK
jgi:TrmH family RNA methyltransferase